MSYKSTAISLFVLYSLGTVRTWYLGVLKTHSSLCWSIITGSRTGVLQQCISNDSHLKWSCTIYEKRVMVSIPSVRYINKIQVQFDSQVQKKFSSYNGMKNFMQKFHIYTTGYYRKIKISFWIFNFHLTSQRQLAIFCTYVSKGYAFPISRCNGNCS